MVLTRCCKILVLWHTNWSFLLLLECTQFSMFHYYRRLQVTNFQFKQYFQNLMRKEKSYWNLKLSWTQELDSYEIDQFQSISSSGKTYPLKILHGRMRSLYRSTQSYSSIEDNTFLKERGMLGHYITSVFPYCCQCSPLIVIVVPLYPQYCYYCALTLLLLGQLGLYCDPIDSYIQKEVMSFVPSNNCPFM